MKRLLLALVLFAIPLHAQSWSGILDTTRAIDWTQAGAGAIPARATICTTLSPGATSAQINTAISGCTAGQTVFLNAGSYSLSGQITFKSNVTLRGAGPDQTIISFTSGGSCNGLGSDVCAINADNNFSGDPHNIATWTAGYSQGATSITFGAVTTGSIANLHVGSQIILDQLNNASDPGLDIYVCGSATPCSQQGSVGNGRTNRQQEQTVTVTSISGSGPWTIGITPGVYAPNWNSGQSPGAWWSSALPITGVGVESLSLNHNSTSQNGSGIMFVNASNSWVKNVRDINNSGTVHKHIWLYQASHITIRDSYLFGSNGTSESYGIDSGFGGSDNLVENVICQQVATCTIGEGSAGTVFAYYFAVNNFYTGAGGVWQQEDAYHHSSGDHYTLWEGNIGSGLTGDDIHGPSFMLTSFRNRWSGRDNAKTVQTNAAHLYSFNRFWNLIGNILGTNGYHVRYEGACATSSDSISGSDLDVYVLNCSGNQGSNFGGLPNDLNTKISLMRWGNYDTVNAANRFVTGEVPSGIAKYANAVPASQTLPSSFYLSSRPSWWGTMPWPSIGPDITGGNIANVGGHAYLNPAANCYLNIMSGPTDGTGAVLTFNANTCYAAVPTQPTNVTITGFF